MTRSGFTLLEVMIALAIVGIALVTLLSLGNRSIGVNTRLQKITQATLLAQERMNRIETDFAQGALLFAEEEGEFEKPFAEYRWSVGFDDTPIPQVRMVTVKVLWGDEAKNELVELSSFLF